MDDRGLLAGGPAQGRGQVNPQTLARHFQDVQARLAGRRFEVIPRAPVDVKDVAPVVDDDTGRGIAIEEGLFEQGRELRLLGAASGLAAADGNGLPPRQHRREPRRQRSGSDRLFAREDPPFLVEHGEVVAQTADALRVPRKRTPPGLRA